MKQKDKEKPNYGSCYVSSRIHLIIPKYPHSLISLI